MNNENVISLADYNNQKAERETHSKYATLLSTLSLTEISHEINDFIGDLKTMMNLGKKEVDQSKLILKELGGRCTEDSCSREINLLLAQVEKQISTLER